MAKAFNGVPVLRGVNLTIRRGETMVILGASGSGKTILLKLIIGLHGADSGEIYLKGQRIDKMKEEDFMRIRTQIGVLFQSGALFDSLTVGHNVAFPLVEHTTLSRKAIARIVSEKLTLVDLVNVEEKMPVELSGGMKKRVALARAIALDPELILYDEPTAGLDPITSDTINDLILTLQKVLNVTSIVVTHDIESAFRVGDRLAFLSEGVIEFIGTIKEARASRNQNLQAFIGDNRGSAHYERT